MEISSANFMGLSVQEVSDFTATGYFVGLVIVRLVLLLYGQCDGRRFKLSLVLELDQE